MKVTIDTNHGVIVLELDEAKAPSSVANFVQYVDEGHYDDSIFHRVIPGFMIQGGGFGSDMKEKATRPTIKNESANGLKNARGTIAMARKPDRDSASAQFFINHADNTSLDGGYAVFGMVVQGMDVVDKLASVPTGNGQIEMLIGPGRHQKAPSADVPKEPATIKSIRRTP